MKILFLDIDGVLNKNGTAERFQGFTGIDKGLLTKFLTWKEKNPEVDVVLSSTWRKEEAFRNHLLENGLSWISVTPHMPSHNRGMEINTWLMKHLTVKAFAILDDTSDMSPVGHSLVQTSERHGLQDKHLRKVDLLLK